MSENVGDGGGGGHRRSGTGNSRSRNARKSRSGGTGTSREAGVPPELYLPAPSSAPMKGRGGAGDDALPPPPTIVAIPSPVRTSTSSGTSAGNRQSPRSSRNNTSDRRSASRSKNRPSSRSRPGQQRHRQELRASSGSGEGRERSKSSGGRSHRDKSRPIRGETTDSGRQRASSSSRRRDESSHRPSSRSREKTQGRSSSRKKSTSTKSTSTSRSAARQSIPSRDQMASADEDSARRQSRKAELANRSERRLYASQTSGADTRLSRSAHGTRGKDSAADSSARRSGGGDGIVPADVIIPTVVMDDEAYARELQAEILREEDQAARLQEEDAIKAMEMQFADEEMARSLAAREAALMTSVGLSPSDLRPERTRGVRQRWSACDTMHKMISFAILAGCVGVILFVLFGIVYRSAGGNVENLPPWFRDSWGQGWEGDYGDGSAADPSSFQRWRTRGNKGLSLTLINALSEDWHGHFNSAIAAWNGGTPRALDLRVVMNSDSPPCEKHTRGMVKVCNADYGQTDWTGLNELLFENGLIVSSVAMMNENYLRNARNEERQYVMCHELGHAWGLPHRDEIVGNRDLGTCMDYTITPRNNQTPDEVDFQNLADIYGEVPERKRRSLRGSTSASSSVIASPGKDIEFERRLPSLAQYKVADAGRRLLHRSEYGEAWITDLGNGRALVTKLLYTGGDR